VPTTTTEYERVLIGGNHLANALIGIIGGNLPDYRRVDFSTVLEKFGQPAADMWVAWVAIMDLRDATEYGRRDAHAKELLEQ
jgi:hypothetical protein